MVLAFAALPIAPKTAEAAEYPTLAAYHAANTGVFTVSGSTYSLVANHTISDSVTVAAGETLNAHSNRRLTLEGTLTVASGGALSLGLGVFTGAMNFSGGTSSMRGGTFSGQAIITLGAGGGTIDTDANNMTLNNSIVGTGSLTKAGSGTLSIVEGNIQYSGSTTVSAGILQVGNGGGNGTLGATSSVSVNSGATLVFNRTGSPFFSYNISGGGNIEKLGTGSVALNGNLTYTGNTTVGAGTLTLGNYTIQPGRAISVNNSATLAIRAGQTITNNGTLTNNGTITSQAGGLAGSAPAPNKANMTGVTFPSGASLTYGQSLAEAAFATQGVGAGAFAFTDPTAKPTVAQSGTSFGMVFTPDAANIAYFNTQTRTITATVIDKAPQAAPSAPTLITNEADRITVDRPADINAGEAWQAAASTTNDSSDVQWEDSSEAARHAFSPLVPNTTYYLFARRAEDVNHYPSPASPALEVSTPRALLGGAVSISGRAEYGQELTADLSALNTAPTGFVNGLAYQWQRGGVDIAGATDAAYTTVVADIGQTLLVVVSATGSSTTTGTVTSAAITIGKSSTAAPAVTYTRAGDPDTTGVTVTVASSVSGVSYSFDGTSRGAGTYGASNTHTYLPGKMSAHIYVRLNETATHLQSPEAYIYIDFTKQGQAAPAAFTMTYVYNSAAGSYTVTIPEVAGAEYSFDGSTYSATRTVTAAPGSTVTGYVRYPGTATRNESPHRSSSLTLKKDGSADTEAGKEPDKAVPAVTKLAAPRTTLWIQSGRSFAIPVVAYEGKAASKSKLSWTSSNKRITVSQKGVVSVPKSMKSGKSTITVKAENGKSLKITVKVSNKAVALNKATASIPKSMKVGTTKKIGIKLSPSKATNVKATFGSSKKDVVTVDKAGTLTAKKKGTATITVKIGKVSVKRMITVK